MECDVNGKGGSAGVLRRKELWKKFYTQNRIKFYFHFLRKESQLRNVLDVDSDDGLGVLLLLKFPDCLENVKEISERRSMRACRPLELSEIADRRKLFRSTCILMSWILASAVVGNFF